VNVLWIRRKKSAKRKRPQSGLRYGILKGFHPLSGEGARVDGGKRVPSGHNAVGVSDPKDKGRLSAKQPSGFAFGEMARFESKIRSAPPFQPKRAVATAVASATIEVAGGSAFPCPPEARRPHRYSESATMLLIQTPFLIMTPPRMALVMSMYSQMPNTSRMGHAVWMDSTRASGMETTHR